MSQIVGASKPSLLEVLAQQAAQDKGPLVVKDEPKPVTHSVDASVADRILADCGDIKISQIKQS